MRLRYSLATLVLLGLGPVACATRSVPEQEPARSPASLAAPAAPPAAVTTALEGDPPLPGEPEGAWTGLRDEMTPAVPDGHQHGDTAPAAPEGHEHHHHEGSDATP